MAKGIELNEIAFAFIAIVAVGLFLVFFLRSYPDIAVSAYCRLHQAANAIIFIGERPPTPPECSVIGGTVRRDLRGTQKSVAQSIAEFALNCWKRGQQGAGGETFNCYEMNIEITDSQPVTEDIVTENVRNMNKCDYLPNNIMDKSQLGFVCGDDNKIIWEEDISAGFFIVKYDAFRKAVVIK